MTGANGGSGAGSATGAGGGSLTGSNGGADVSRLKYGFYIVIGGLISVIALYIATIFIFANLTPDDVANNVVACMGAVTGVIGSIVAAFFGVQLGASGKEASDATAAKQAALASAAMGQIEDPQKSTAASTNRADSRVPTVTPSS
jgi:NhaP-type Na+/H+ or K+/H+ antiporter